MACLILPPFSLCRFEKNQTNQKIRAYFIYSPVVLFTLTLTIKQWSINALFQSSASKRYVYSKNDTVFPPTTNSPLSLLVNLNRARPSLLGVKNVYWLRIIRPQRLCGVFLDLAQSSPHRVNVFMLYLVTIPLIYSTHHVAAHSSSMFVAPEQC